MPSFITIGKIVLFEPLLFGLIFISAISCIIFGLYNSRDKIKDQEFKNLKTLLFLFLGLSLLFGAVTHGFFPNFVSGRLILWKASLVILGLSALVNFFIAGYLWNYSKRKLIYFIAIAEFIFYQFYVTSINSDFDIALTNYFISVAFFYLVSFKIKNLKNKNLGIFAFLLLFSSFLFYIFRITLQKDYFNYVILYHLLFFGSNILMFKYCKWMIVKHNI